MRTQCCAAMSSGQCSDCPLTAPVRPNHHTPLGTGGGRTAEQVLRDAGVFLGADGLRGLAESTEFWEDKPYGTRLYFGPNASHYLHRDVLRAAVRVLDDLGSVASREAAGRTLESGLPPHRGEVTRSSAGPEETAGSDTPATPPHEVNVASNGNAFEHPEVLEQERSGASMATFPGRVVKAQVAHRLAFERDALRVTLGEVRTRIATHLAEHGDTTDLQWALAHLDASVPPLLSNRSDAPLNTADAVCGLCGGTGRLGDRMMSDCPRGCGNTRTVAGDSR